MVKLTEEEKRQIRAYQDRNDKSLGWNRVNEKLKELDSKWRFW